jgi:hypothetical protein
MCEKISLSLRSFEMTKPLFGNERLHSGQKAKSAICGRASYRVASPSHSAE